MPRNTTLVATADPKLESILEGFDDGLSYRILRYRGVTYRLDELPIGEYQKLETQATISKENLSSSLMRSAPPATETDLTR